MALASLTMRVRLRQVAGPLLIVQLLAATPAASMAVPAGEGQLELTVVDKETGSPIASRMHLKTAIGRPRLVKDTPFWDDHFVVPGKIVLRLPLGNYSFEIERGPEYKIVSA
jgi:hypothetical protein